MKLMTTGLFICAMLLLSTPSLLATRSESTLLDVKNPGLWESDGMWRVSAREDGVEFYKDEKPMHNSMCWTTLPGPLKRGQTIEITYQMQVAEKHVDMFFGENCGRPDVNAPLPEFAEVVSLGGITSTGWETKRITITSDKTINTLGFLAWGWAVDRDSWMKVASIKVLPVSGNLEWFVWRVAPPMNQKSVPSRNKLQDFFPFGVYLPMESGENYKSEGLKDRWEWYDRALADIKARGMNFVSVTNLVQEDLDRLADLHAKHGLRMNPQVGEFNIKYHGEGALKPFIQAVSKYKDSSVIAGWAVGEEFAPGEMSKLDLPHEIVHAIDSDNSLVTIQHQTDLFRITGEKLDVRVIMRDIYPFFDAPKHGPATYEASINYYEDEIDKCRRYLPKGASLWVMPQGFGGDWIDGVMLWKKPTPAQIRVQMWSALAYGAKGFAYFLYPSLGDPVNKPGLCAFWSLRAKDGSPTPMLEEMTILAKKMVPLGNIITGWEKSEVPAASDHRDLRVYLFTGKNKIPYAVVYNRGADKPVKGRVRLPFVCTKVEDITTRGSVSVTRDGNATIIPVSLAPGDGTILKLAGKMPDDWDDDSDAPRVAGRTRLDLPLIDLPDGRKLLRYKVDFQKTGGIPVGDSISSDVDYKDWKDQGQTHMNGVYGSEVTFAFEMPGKMTEVSASGLFANHADTNKYPFAISISTNGKDFRKISDDNFIAFEPRVKGQTAVSEKTSKVWVRYELPRRDPLLVLKNVDIEVVSAMTDKDI